MQQSWESSQGQSLPKLRAFRRRQAHSLKSPMKANAFPIQPGTGTESRRCAFTLVELLVVIAIIGILSSMILTALTTAKGVAERTECLNNMRQLSLAVKLYSTDNKGAYVPDTGTGVRWPYEMYNEYGRNTKVLTCPTDLKRGIPANYGVDNKDPIDTATRSFVMNAFNEFLVYSPSNSLNYMRENWIQIPAATIILGEKSHRQGSFWMDVFPPWASVSDLVSHIQHGMHGAPRPSKSGGHNSGFADGHVAYYGFGKDISPIDMWYVYPMNRTAPLYTTDLLPKIKP
jgi:prepilin-type N-terminal cleavage/methylation domain-containing protein/prepilin-type processing-associated H-X9-DG protein